MDPVGRLLKPFVIKVNEIMYHKSFINFSTSGIFTFTHVNKYTNDSFGEKLIFSDHFLLHT